MGLVYDNDLKDGVPRRVFGVCLPDGRFILPGAHGGVSTFSSEAMLLRFNPGARLIWRPQIDATINHVLGEDEDAA